MRLSSSGCPLETQTVRLPRCSCLLLPAFDNPWRKPGMRKPRNLISWLRSFSSPPVHGGQAAWTNRKANPDVKLVIALAATLFAGPVLGANRGDDTPMSYLRTFGPAADPAAQLNLGTLAISIAVVVIVSLLLLWAILRRRPPLTPDAEGRLPVLPERGGMSWIVLGVGVTVVVLLLTTFWTVQALSAVSAPSVRPRLEVDVIAHQWWWEFRYKGDNPEHALITANELHIPVGEPVRLNLRSEDVIHSFWVPQLGGKTDVIPGQRNHAWLQAARPGDYRGQCGEFCGAQHAHMAMWVVAQDRADFEAWRAGQRQAARAPAAAAAVRGQQVFAAHCAKCHTVRGTKADGRDGPDLTHLMSRSSIAAGTVPNNVGALSGWVANAQAVKPGAHMPAMQLAPEDLHAVVTYLQELQ